MTPAPTSGPEGGASFSSPPPSRDVKRRASPGRRRARPSATDRAVREYAARYAGLLPVTEGYVTYVSGLLDDAGINYLSVSGRTKAVDSFAAKAARTLDGRPLYADPLHEITDQVGVRVITYLQSDVAAVADLLTDQCSVIQDRDLGEETASEGRFGYASRHLLLTVRGGEAATAGGSATPAAQVQIRTVLQHAWAEFEHDIRYKGSIPAHHAPELDRRFALAAGLLELADREFSAIRERLRGSATVAAAGRGGGAVRIEGQELAAFLDARFGDAGWSRTDRYDWMCGLLTELGITTLEELAGLLLSVDTEAINSRMGYRYPAGAVRRLDDTLLAVFGPRYLALEGNARRTELLTTRLERIRGLPVPPIAQDPPGGGDRRAGDDGDGLR